MGQGHAALDKRWCCISYIHGLYYVYIRLYIIHMIHIIIALDRFDHAISFVIKGDGREASEAALRVGAPQRCTRRGAPRVHACFPQHFNVRDLLSFRPLGRSSSARSGTRPRMRRWRPSSRGSPAHAHYVICMLCYDLEYLSLSLYIYIYICIIILYYSILQYIKL